MATKKHLKKEIVFMENQLYEVQFYFIEDGQDDKFIGYIGSFDACEDYYLKAKKLEEYGKAKFVYFTAHNII